MSAKLSLLALALVSLLAACGPDTQTGSSTTLGGDQNTQIAGVVVTGSTTPLSPEAVAAARARVPYQYREKEPLDLFDYARNLNPTTNRSVPAN